ncbi:MAG: PKD-like family lipoprotein [Mangrovibacterium sp.]
MKKLIYLLMVVAFTSCFKDLGNYDYDELDEIIIENMPTELGDLILFEDTIRINPVVYLGEKESPDSFNYYWSKKEGSGNDAELVRFSEEKNLEMAVQTSGEITLMFEAENKETGVIRFETVKGNGTSRMSNGYYLLKENEAGNTDIDMIGFDSTTGEVLVFADLMETAFDGALEGSPVTLNYWGYRYEDYETAKLTAVPGLYVVSNKDMVVINPDKFEILNTFDGLFLGDVPVNRNIQALKSIQKNTMLINDGKVYCFTNYYTAMVNSVSTEFGGNRFYPAMTGDYKMESCISWPVADNGSTFLTYDTMSGLFKYVITSALQPPTVKETSTTTYFQNNMNADLLMLESRATGAYGYDVYALFRGKQNADSLSIVTMNAQRLNDGVLSYKASKYIKAPERLIDNASHYCVHQHYAFIYFSVEDKLYLYDVSSDTETLIKTFDGEEITHIDVTNEWYATSGATIVQTQYTKMVVATNSAAGYTFRKYDLSSAGLPSTDPIFTSNGQGKVSGYMYIKPSSIPIWVRTYN